MPRQRKKPVQDTNRDNMKADPVRFKPLPMKGNATDWWSRLKFLTLAKNRGRWALVRTMETPEQAYHAQDNLSRRKVSFPNPDDDWSFAARGTEVYAIYRGPIANKKQRRKELKAS